MRPYRTINAAALGISWFVKKATEITETAGRERSNKAQPGAENEIQKWKALRRSRRNHIKPCRWEKKFHKGQGAFVAQLNL